MRGFHAVSFQQNVGVLRRIHPHGPMKVDLAIVLPCTLQDAVVHVMSTRLLQYVSHPLVSFSPPSGSSFPETWTEGTHWVDVKLFGFLPFGRQAIVITRPAVPSGFAIRDAGHSALIPVWDHLITISPTDSGVHYRDQVTVSAGILTPLVWLFARIFYHHRQRRWLRLASNGFDYGAA
jgi:hypothetical protein